MGASFKKRDLFCARAREGRKGGELGVDRHGDGRMDVGYVSRVRGRVLCTVQSGNTSRVCLQGAICLSGP